MVFELVFYFVLNTCVIHCYIQICSFSIDLFDYIARVGVVSQVKGFCKIILYWLGRNWSSFRLRLTLYRCALSYLLCALVAKLPPSPLLSCPLLTARRGARRAQAQQMVAYYRLQERKNLWHKYFYCPNFTGTFSVRGEGTFSEDFDGLRILRADVELGAKVSCHILIPHIHIKKWMKVGN